MTRYHIVLLCACLSGACADNSVQRSAFFCQGEAGPGYSATAAIRLIPDGDVQFAVSKWQENGHHFGLAGIAQRDGDHWVYKERERRSFLNMEDQLVYEVDANPNAMPTCKVTVFWPRTDDLRILVDPKIGCQDHHGRAFGWFSSRFGVADYNGAVRGELDGSDQANLGQRCNERGVRRGPVRVVRDETGAPI